MTKQLRFVKELELELDALMQPIALLGNRGGGKTYAGTALFEVAHDAGVQCVAIDGIAKWWGLRQGKDGHGPGLKDVFIFGGKRGDFPLSPDKGAFVAKVLVEKRVSAVLDVSLMRKGDRRRFVTDFAEEFYLLKKQADVAEPCVLFLEEAHQFIPQKPQADEARMLGAFEDIVSEGRNAGLGVVVMDQRPARANKNVLALVEILLVLRTTYKNDRDVYADWIVQRAAEGAENVDLHKVLPFLKAGHGYLYAPLYERFGKVTVLPKRTFDSSATAKVGVAVKEIGTLTPIDVAELTDAMAEVVAEAEQRSPDLLKRRIRQLEAELAAKPKVPPPGWVDPKPIAYRLDPIVNQLLAMRGELAGVTEPSAITSRDPDGPTFTPRPSPSARKVVTEPPAPPIDGAPQLKKGAREMLREAIALYPRPLSRRELAVRALLSPGSGTTGDYLSALKRAGMLMENPNGIGYLPTSAALQAKQIPVRPKGKAELVTAWLPEFKKGARLMLQAAVDADGPLRRPELAKAAGIDPSSGTTGDYLSHLRRTGVLEQTNAGYVLAPSLSLGGA